MARPTTTLVYVSRRVVARADFHGVSPDGLWVRPRPEAPDLPSAVELALTLGPAVGRRVWVLAADLWTQTLGLPMGKVAGMGGPELAAALNFEAETHSGVSALEASAGIATQPPLTGRREAQFWITQVTNTDREL